jgi:hypothetical protein
LFTIPITKHSYLQAPSKKLRAVYSNAARETIDISDFSQLFIFLRELKRASPFRKFDLGFGWERE